MTKIIDGNFDMPMYIRNFLNTLSASNKAQNIFALVIIFLFFWGNILNVRRGYSQTRDEDKHYQYGENILAGDSSRFDDSKMPVSALNALPAKIAQFTGNDRLIQIGSRFYIARSVTIFFSCLIAFLVFYWARSLYGFIPALFSLLLYVLDPNIIAHSQLVTTDIYATGTIAFAFFRLWKFANERTWKNGVWCAFSLGISQLAKYSAVVLFPLFFITLLSFEMANRNKVRNTGVEIKTIMVRYFKYSIFAILVSVLVINVGFVFNRTFTLFGDYVFRSDFFQNIQSRNLLLNQLPVPVPYPYLQGLDLIRFNEQTGASYGNIYLLGHISAVKGFPGYFIIASILKLPIASLIILVLAFAVYFTQKDHRSSFFRHEMFLLVSIAFFTFYLNFFYNTQIGIRHYLVVFPMLYVFSGNLFSGWKNFTVAQKSLSWGLIVYIFVSVYSYYPYHLSYFNEVIWDRTQAYKYLADSNIDWGQGQSELWEYISDHPSAVYQPGNIRAGQIIVSVNDLVGINIDPGQYAWLRNNFEPDDTIAYTYLVYNVAPEELDAMCAETDYC